MINFSARFAIDQKSARTYDQDGHLHVSSTNISKANVCPYLGREIPDGDKMGLDPEKVYKLYRDPKELAKAAASFNGKPILRKHIPISSDEHQPGETIGAVGTNVRFEYPYLKSDIVIWPKKDIHDIESELKKELSSAYRYRADMTPGEVEGEKYDGVMRDIVGNHVALVEEGRAGSDVVVGDSQLKRKETAMAARYTPNKIILTRKAALLAGAIDTFMRPKLAADSKDVFKFNFPKLLGTVTAKNLAKKKGAIIAGIKEQTRGKLAADASVEGLVDLLDGIEELETPEAGDAGAMETNPNTGVPMAPIKEEEEAGDDDVHAGLRAVLEKAGVPDDIIEQACAAVGGAGDAELEDPLPKEKLGGEGAAEKGEDEEMTEGEKMAAKPAPAKDKKAKDEPPPFKGKPEVGKGPPMTGDQVNKLITAALARQEAANRKAMDEAISGARNNARAVRDAERDVRPWVGDIQVACDSAEQVYETALTALGVDTADVHPSAFKHILAAQPLPSKEAEVRRLSPRAPVAMDAASAKSVHERFPGIRLVKHA